jgi:hypothetical protein
MPIAFEGYKSISLHSAAFLIPQDAQSAPSVFQPPSLSGIPPQSMASRAEFSEGEDEELMFAFEEEQDGFSPRLHSGGSQIFHSIDGVEFERPANPMAAVLERQEERNNLKRGRASLDEDEPEADLAEEKPVTPLQPGGRKRKTFLLPSAPARVIRPLAKRLKSNAFERSVTAPACLMGNLSLNRTKEPVDMAILELEGEHVKVPFRSASISIPDSFKPIHWPGDAMADRAHSCSSSSSSSKSWTSGLLCRRSLDVSSPLTVGIDDMALHSSAGSYTGS